MPRGLVGRSGTMGPMGATIRFCRRYPWEAWFSRLSFRVVKGVHFDCTVHGMAQMIRNQAAKRGVRVSLKLSDWAIKARVR